MLIILEGADGSGKTTLLKKFLDDGIICKRCLRHEDVDWNKLCYLAKDTDIVIDRSFITDLVYRLVQGGNPESIALKTMIPIIDKSIIVLCETSNMFEESMKRGEDNIIDKDTAQKIKDMYDTIVKKMICMYCNPKGVCTYNFRDENAYHNLKVDIKTLKGGIDIK